MNIKIMWSVIAAICLAALLAPVSGFAATYYVATTGSDVTGNGSAANPWATIDRGDVLGVLAAGDTVSVAAGTYNGSVHLGTHSAGVLYQADAAGVTVKSTGAWSAWEVGSSVGLAGYGYSSSMGYTGPTIDGFKIVGGNPGWYGALSLYSAWNTEVRNCVIDGGGGSTVPYIGSLVMNTGAGNYIHNNVILYGGAGNAVYINDSRFDGNRIINNTIKGNPGGWGINVTGYQAGYQPGLGAYAGKYDSVLNNIVDGGFYGLSTPSSYTVNCGFNLLNAGNAYGGGASQAPGDIVGVSPMLDATYHLQTGSPAIDAGTFISLPYNGNYPDLGAFETAGAPGATPITVSGIVTDMNTSAPIAGAQVVIGHGFAITDASGSFSLLSLTGSQSYFASKSPYRTKTGTVEVVSGNPVNLQLVSGPATFYVSTTGSDTTGDGSDGNPWATIDYADAHALLLPGDTVYVKAGTYDIDTDARTNGVYITDKSVGVTYQADPVGVTIHQSNYFWGDALVKIYSWNGNADKPIVFSGFTLLGGSGQANMWIYNSKYVEVKNCVLDSTGYQPYQNLLLYTGSGIQIHNNVITGRSISFDSRLLGNKWYNNTFVCGTTGANYAMCFAGYQDGYQPGCMGNPGAPLTADRDEFINNVIDSGYPMGLQIQVVSGFVYPLSVTHDYNLFSNNATPIDGDVLAAHETSNLDAALDVDYHLLAYSPAIDSGLDVGFPFLGSAPDKGAFEFDGIPVASVKLSEIGSKADGTQVVISDTLVATVRSTVFADNSYYVEDPSRANGIKVVGGTVDAGDRVTIAGTLGTESSGERVILDASVLNRTAGTPLGALGMNNKTLGGGPSSFQPGITGATGTNNIGLLVTVFGRVVSTGSGEFTLDDGSGVNLRVILPIGIAEPTAPFVTVTGISSCETVGADCVRLLKATGAAY